MSGRGSPRHRVPGRQRGQRPLGGGLRGQGRRRSSASGVRRASIGRHGGPCRRLHALSRLGAGGRAREAPHGRIERYAAGGGSSRQARCVRAMGALASPASQGRGLRPEPCGCPASAQGPGLATGVAQARSRAFAEGEAGFEAQVQAQGEGQPQAALIAARGQPRPGCPTPRADHRGPVRCRGL